MDRLTTMWDLVWAIVVGYTLAGFIPFILILVIGGLVWLFKWRHEDDD